MLWRLLEPYFDALFMYIDVCNMFVVLIWPNLYPLATRPVANKKKAVGPHEAPHPGHRRSRSRPDIGNRPPQKASNILVFVTVSRCYHVLSWVMITIGKWTAPVLQPLWAIVQHPRGACYFPSGHLTFSLLQDPVFLGDEVVISVVMGPLPV